MASTDKSTILKTFNQTFFDFMNDMISIFPENTDIVAGKKFFELTKKANPSLIIKVWHTNIYRPYSDTIDAGDISFFFEKDYQSDVGALDNSAEVLKFIDSLRPLVRMMGDTNKSHTINYIQILSRLSDVYNQL